MSDNKSLTLEALKGTFFLGSWSTASKLIAIANSFIVLYLLSVYEYGLYVLVLSAVSMAEWILLENMDQLVITDIIIAKNQNNLQRAKRIYQEYFLFKLIAALIGFVVLLSGSNIIAQTMGYSSIGLFVKLGAFIVLIRGSMYFAQINLRINKKFNQMGAFTFFAETFKLAILGVVFFAFDPGIAKIILSLILSQGLAFVLLIYVNREDFKFWFSNFKIDIRNLLLWKILRGHGKWNLFSGFIYKFNKNAKLWIVQLLLSTEAVAYYNFGKNLFSHLDGLVPVRVVLAQILPGIALDKRRLQRAFIDGAKYISLINIGAALAGIVAVPIMVWLLFPKYIISIPIFYIFLLSFVFYGGFSLVTDSILFALRQQKWLTYAPILKLFSLVIFSSLLLPIWGIYGMAAEFVITMFLNTVIMYFMTIKKLELPWWSFVKVFSYTPRDSEFLDALRRRFKSKKSPA